MEKLHRERGNKSFSHNFLIRLKNYTGPIFQQKALLASRQSKKPLHQRPSICAR